MDRHRVGVVEWGLTWLRQVAPVERAQPQTLDVLQDSHLVTNDTPLGGARERRLGQQRDEQFRLKQVPASPGLR